MSEDPEKLLTKCRGGVFQRNRPNADGRPLQARISLRGLRTCRTGRSPCAVVHFRLQTIGVRDVSMWIALPAIVIPYRGARLRDAVWLRADRRPLPSPHGRRRHLHRRLRHRLFRHPWRRNRLATLRNNAAVFRCTATSSPAERPPAVSPFDPRSSRRRTEHCRSARACASPISRTSAVWGSRSTIAALSPSRAYRRPSESRGRSIGMIADGVVGKRFSIFFRQRKGAKAEVNWARALPPPERMTTQMRTANGDYGPFFGRER